MNYPVYIYRGDRMTDPDLAGQHCTAVRRPDGKCIRGSNGNMLVVFASDRVATVVARRLKRFNNGCVDLVTQSNLIDTLFNSVELKLIEMRKIHCIPSAFVNRPQKHLRTLVKAWGQIYQESRCTVDAANCTVWKRSSTCPAKRLDRPALVSSLQQIKNMINLEALLRFRTISKGDKAALALLVY